MVQSGDPKLSIAHTFLTMPDLFNFFLTGVKANEFTNATTTQCYNPVEKKWDIELLQGLDIPPHIFDEIVNPGTVLAGRQSHRLAFLYLRGHVRRTVKQNKAQRRCEQDCLLH